MSAAVSISKESGPSNVRMTPAAIEALRKLERPQAESVARAIAAIGMDGSQPVVARDDGKDYLVMVPDDDQAPVVTYRADDGGAYLVTALVDRDTYETFEITERPGFLQSTTFKATVGAAAAAALGIILGSRATRALSGPAATRGRDGPGRNAGKPPLIGAAFL